MANFGTTAKDPFEFSMVTHVRLIDRWKVLDMSLCCGSHFFQQNSDVMTKTLPATTNVVYNWYVTVAPTNHQPVYGNRRRNTTFTGDLCSYGKVQIYVEACKPQKYVIKT